MKFALTGTHVYGPVGPNSDLDIVVMKKDVHDLMLFLVEHKIEHYRTAGQDEYGDAGGFYFDLAGIKINIIVANSKFEFNEWKARTENMKKLPPIEDRLERLFAFNDYEHTHKEVKS